MLRSGSMIALVKRVRHRADHAVRGVARQFGVGVKGDDEANFRQHGKIADLYREAVVLVAQQLVEVHQLAALALPTHPDSFARVVDAVAVQQHEQALALAAMLFVQVADEFGAEFDQRIVFLRRFLRVGQVGDQREVDVGIVIADVANLKVLDQAADLLFVEQQAGNGDQSKAVVRECLSRSRAWGGCWRRESK